MAEKKLLGRLVNGGVAVHGFRQGPAPGNGAKVGKAQLQGNGPGGQALRAKAVAYLRGELLENKEKVFAVKQVPGKGYLFGNGLGLLFLLQGTMVDPVGILVQLHSSAAQEADQGGPGEAGQVSHGPDSVSAQLLPGRRADARDYRHRERPQPLRHLLGPEGADAVGLDQFAGDLGQQLVYAYPHAEGKPQFFPHRPADGLRRLQAGPFFYRQVGFVDGDKLKLRGKAAQDPADLPGNSLVPRQVNGPQDGFGA